MIRVALAVAFTVALTLPASATVFGGGDFNNHVLQSGLSTSVLSPPVDDLASPVFDTGDPEATTWGLPSTGTVSGMTLLAQYVGSDVSADATEVWTGTGSLAVDLTSNGEGATERLNPSPVWDVDSVTTPNDRFVSSSAPGVAFGTQDLVVEILARSTPDTGGNILLSNTDAGAGENGIEIFGRNLGNGRAYARFCTSVGCQDTYADHLGTTEKEWHIIVALFDRDGYMAIATEDTSFNTGVVDAMTESGEDLNNGTRGFTIGGRASTDTLNFDTDIAWVRIWGCDGCLSVDATPSEYDAGKDAFFAKVAGSELTAPSATVPSVSTRASNAFLRTCDPATDTITLHPVGDNWPRREISCGYTWDSPTSSETRVSSFLVEPAATNEMGYSEDFTAEWTGLGSATITADQAAAPDGATTADAINTTTGEQSGYLNQATSFLTGNFTFSVFLKDVTSTNETHAAVYFDTANCGRHVDLSDCSMAGNVNNDCAADWVEDWGNGWCRLSINDETAASSIRIYGSTDGTSLAATGDNGASAYVWGAVADDVIDYPTSYIKTVDATDVTRSADALNYDWDTPLFTTAWTGIASVNYPDDGAATPQRNVWTLSNDGSASELIQFRPDTVTNGRTSMQVVDLAGGDSTNVSPFAAVELPDGAHHITRGYGGGAAEAFACVDGTCGSGITADSVSENLDRVHVGASRTNGGTAGGSIHRLRVFDQAIAPGEQGTSDDVP